MLAIQERKLSAKTPVLDHADQVLYYASREKARELIAARRVEVVGGRRRIDALRLTGPDPALLPGPRGRKPQCGAPHRHENYWNVRGVWHIDQIRPSLVAEFDCVLERTA